MEIILIWRCIVLSPQAPWLCDLHQVTGVSDQDLVYSLIIFLWQLCTHFVSWRLKRETYATDTLCLNSIQVKFCNKQLWLRGRVWFSFSQAILNNRVMRWLLAGSSLRWDLTYIGREPGQEELVLELVTGLAKSSLNNCRITRLGDTPCDLRWSWYLPLGRYKTVWKVNKNSRAHYFNWCFKTYLFWIL